jgi:hypothetical protein
MTPLRAFLVLRRDLVCFYRVVIIVALHHRTSMLLYDVDNVGKSINSMINDYSP